jgi:hypothetical protein
MLNLQHELDSKELNEELMDADILANQKAYYDDNQQQQTKQTYMHRSDTYNNNLEIYKVPKKVRKPVDPARQKEKGLHDIFDFYSKQHVMQGNKMTFDEIGKEGARLA